MSLGGGFALAAEGAVEGAAIGSNVGSIAGAGIGAYYMSDTAEGIAGDAAGEMYDAIDSVSMPIALVGDN